MARKAKHTHSGRAAHGWGRIEGARRGGQVGLTITGTPHWVYYYVSTRWVASSYYRVDTYHTCRAALARMYDGQL